MCGSVSTGAPNIGTLSHIDGSFRRCKYRCDSVWMQNLAQMRLWK